MSIDDNFLQDPFRNNINVSINHKDWESLANKNMKNLERICDDIKKDLDIKFFARDIIEKAPTFKELLWAIMDEKREHLLNTDLYKFIEKRIKDRCEEAANNLKDHIPLEELRFYNSDQLFKSMNKGNYNSSSIIEIVRCVCEKLDLNFNGNAISWGRTSVSPEE